MNDLDTLLDRALNEPLLRPPADFAERVYLVLPARAQTVSPPRPRHLAVRWLRGALLALVGSLGAVQTASYVISLWTAALVSVA